VSTLFSLCPTCHGIDAQPDPTGAMAMFCPVCEDLFPVDASAIRPDRYPEAVRAADRALFDDNLIWITTPNNSLAKEWGGPTDARHLAAVTAVDAALAVLMPEVKR
jgi:hypothetical protein